MVQPVTGDEVIFIAGPEVAETLPEATLARELTAVLGRKVWVTTDGPQWAGRTSALFP